MLYPFMSLPYGSVLEYMRFMKVHKNISTKSSGPIIMCEYISCSRAYASQNWDDHDRSGKYTATAMAKAYLNSCAPMPFYS
jgi:hypothetical protein